MAYEEKNLGEELRVSMVPGADSRCYSAGYRSALVHGISSVRLSSMTETTTMESNYELILAGEPSAQLPEINELDSAPKTVKRGRPRKGDATSQPDRPRRRRMNLNSVDGTIRESIRTYRDLAEGRVSILEAEARGRQLRRHLDLLSAKDEREQLARIEQALRDLQAARTQPALPAPTKPAALPEWAQEDS